jgi:serralysin
VIISIVAPSVGSGASALAIQKDGKIIAAGSGSGYVNNTPSGPSGDFTMARYNTDGSIDSSFNHNGKVFTDFMGDESATAIALQDNGKIILGGNRYYGHRNECIVARYNTNGSSDSTFHGGAAFPSFGPTSDYTTGVAVQSDGKVLLSGYYFNQIYKLSADT